MNEEQQKVIDSVKLGKNVFFSGPAGSGKTYTINAIVKELKNRMVFVTASTGTAATLINGTTLHSFAGIGLGNDTPENLLKKVRKNVYAMEKWIKCQTLIIDEISMIGKTLMETLDYIGRKVRKNDKPWGNIQLILCGDFFQLPPINDKYAFCVHNWNQIAEVQILLTKIHRQVDPDLIEGLNNVRVGILTDKFEALLNNPRTLVVPDGIKPTVLMSKNEQVNEINNAELDKLPGPKITFESVDYVNPMSFRSTFEYPIGTSITLAKGAQIICVKNKKGFYCNGTRGIVVDIEPGVKVIIKTINGLLEIEPEEFEIQSRGIIIASRRGIPLKLAWALSIHKSQGMTIDYLDINLEKVFTYSQTYVALSRAKNLAGLSVIGLSKRVVYCNKEVLAFYESIMNEPVKPVETKDFKLFNDLNKDLCCICLAELKDKKMSVLSCGHAFHQTCSITITMCPVCRQETKE